MTYAACTLAYNDQDIIAGTIKCLKPYVDKHIVLLSEKPYFGEACEPDRTEEICEDLGCQVIKGTWSLDHFQRNLGQKLCADVDWIFTFDSDELMTHTALEELIKMSEKTSHDAIACVPEVYWYDTDHVLRPKPSYQPIIMTRPRVRFTHIRNIDSGYDLFPWTMHHLSWCKPKDILKKVQCYAHASDFTNAKEWYENNFIGWHEGPVVMPDGYMYDAVYIPLPKELKDLL